MSLYYQIAAGSVLLSTILAFSGAAASSPQTGRASQSGAPGKTAARTAQQAACAAAFFESLYEGETPPEAVRMLVAILKGSKMGPGEGWFGPAQTRYTWEWLAQRCGVEPQSGRIPRDRFCGPAAWFARLDRNGDGILTPDDLDWSDQNPYLRMSRSVDWLFRRLNTAGTGRLSKQELLQFFEKAAQGKDYLTPEDFRQALLANLVSDLRGDLPEQRTLLRALFRGDIGSLYEGPRLNEPAPHFALKTVEGTQTIQLAQLLGTKPLVLVFGSFTCGPFRAQVPAVEELYQRYRAHANFLAIYVREAHPTDGWHMVSNERAGIAIPQPQNWSERQAIAQKCRHRLSLTFPLVVDTMDDHVGHAYSGMPSRLYLIDRAGRVAYKSGRGPFGFQPGELEQSLVMLLLEETAATAAGPSPAQPASGGKAR
jgi:thiol-disulfide isomerase/thioredoxin